MARLNVPAVVLGGDINGLGITRNLGKVGVEVYCVVDRLDPVGFSRYCRKCFVVPHLKARLDLLPSFLAKVVMHIRGPVVVFPTDDMTTLFLSGLQSETNRRYIFVAPAKEVAEKLIEKDRFYESLDEEGIDHPRVVHPQLDSDVREAGEKLGYPLFIRPCLSQRFFHVFRTKGFIANSPSELEHYYRLALGRDLRVLFQEIVPGRDANMCGVAGLLDKASRPLALFGYHRIRGWPVTFGNSSLMESVSVSRLAYPRDVTIKYLRHIGYYGMFDAEFKRDPRDGKYKFLEVNARSWWQNSLPTKCGLNIVHKAYLNALGQEVKCDAEYVGGIKWINLLDDIRSSIVNREILGRDWIKSLSQVKEHAFFDRSDLAPYAINLFQILRDVVGGQRALAGILGEVRQ
jgi:predicted ATP-grasp superfamily ATP-dependent carboligase